jgi:hypothetical protein
MYWLSRRPRVSGLPRRLHVRRRKTRLLTNPRPRIPYDTIRPRSHKPRQRKTSALSEMLSSWTQTRRPLPTLQTDRSLPRRLRDAHQIGRVLHHLCMERQSTRRLSTCRRLTRLDKTDQCPTRIGTGSIEAGTPEKPE